jgi:hypothetical protein
LGFVFPLVIFYIGLFVSYSALAQNSATAYLRGRGATIAAQQLLPIHSSLPNGHGGTIEIAVVDLEYLSGSGATGRGVALLETGFASAVQPDLIHKVRGEMTSPDLSAISRAASDAAGKHCAAVQLDAEIEKSGVKLVIADYAVADTDPTLLAALAANKGTVLAVINFGSISVPLTSTQTIALTPTVTFESDSINVELTIPDEPPTSTALELGDDVPEFTNVVLDLGTIFLNAIGGVTGLAP